MKSYHGLLILWLVVMVGCATFADSPPSPPLAVPVPGAPTEYTWSPVKWKPGSVLTYATHEFVESNPATAMAAWCRQLKKAEPKVQDLSEDPWCRALGSDQNRYTVQMKVLEKTLKGAVRVQLLVEGTVLGYFMVGEGGGIQDVAPEIPEFAKALKTLSEGIESPCAREVHSRTLRIGEKVTVRCSTGVDVGFEFVGYVHLDEQPAAAFQSEAHYSSDMLADALANAIARLAGNKGEGVVIAGASSIREELYYSTGGFLLAMYRVSTQSGNYEGSRFVMRAISSTTLDRQRSSGL